MYHYTKCQVVVAIANKIAPPTSLNGEPGIISMAPEARIAVEVVGDVAAVDTLADEKRDVAMLDAVIVAVAEATAVAETLAVLLTL